jgi:hypothetical protein
MAARIRDGADAAGVMAGAPQVVGDGLAEAVADGLVEGLGEGLVALGVAPQAIEPRRATAAREANRPGTGADYPLAAP